MIEKKLQNNGVGKNMLNIVQYITWTKQYTTSMYLCATRTSIEFYQTIGFDEYTNDKSQLAPTIAEALADEDIHYIGKDHQMFPMCILNQLLSATPLNPLKILSYYATRLKHIKHHFLLGDEKEASMWGGMDKNHNNIQSTIEKECNRIDKILKDSEFDKYEVREYNIMMDRIMLLTETETNTEKARLHTAFINDHCFVNFGQIVGNASIELFLKVGATPSMKVKSSKKAGTHFLDLY